MKGKSTAIIGIVLGAFAMTPRADAVDLRFAWKPGMVCKVQNTMLIEKSGQKTALTLRYDLKVTAAADGDLFVGIENPTLDPVPGMPEGQRSLFASQIALTNMPDMRVHAGGELAGLRDYEASRARLQAVFEKTLPSVQKNPKVIERVMQTVGTREIITSTAYTFWTPTVDRWVSGALEPGKPLQFELPSQSPLGFAVTMKGKVEMVSKFQCPSGNTSRRCVLLKSTESADPEQIKKGIAEFVAKQDPKVNMGEITTIDMRIEMEAVTEPDTLIPRRVLSVKKTTMSGTEGGQPRTMEQNERREWHFDCKEPAIATNKSN